MSKVQVMIYTAFIFLEIMSISSIMEIYKKMIRKDRAKKFEIYIIAEVLSAFAIAILVLLGIFKPILGLIGAPLWSDYVFYNILIFIFQMQADMKIIKKLIKSCASELLKAYGFTAQQIEDVFNSISKES